MQAFMSILNLMANNSNFQFEGKLATLWFDKILLGTDNQLIKNTIMQVAEKECWKEDVLENILKIQTSAELVLPEIEFMTDRVDAKKYEIATEMLKSEYEEELKSKETYAAAMHEIIMGGAGITSTVRYWMLLNGKEKCVFLPEKHEKKMIQRIFEIDGNADYNSFTNIITHTIPDISNYSWDEIIDLRHHQYWEQFRKKITDLNDSFADEKLTADIFDEIVHRDLAEMAKQFRPHVGKNIVKGVVCNMPLPIPINPASIICTGYDIKKEIDFEKKYGWIYFYLDNKNQ